MLLLEETTKTYSKDGLLVTALPPINLAVQPGEFVALQGPSGSGKTTCLLIAGGLLRPDGGKVFVNGLEIYDLTPNQLAGFRSRHIGFVFQQYHLIPYLTVLENILAPTAAAGGRNNGERGRALAKKFGIDHRLNHTPAELSSGERQRTALARALLFQPQIILADEITGNLDEENAQVVMGYLKEYVRTEGSVLLVTHDRKIAEQADRVAHLPDSRGSEAKE